MNKKIFLIFGIFVLILLAFAQVASAQSNFVIRNESNSSQNYFIVNGTTSNADFTGNVTTTNWFKGIFNWVVGSGISQSYLDFNGTDLDFNESYLNGTIDSRISSQGVNISVNSSDYWDSYDVANSTQFENNGGTLNIVVSWLEGLFISDSDEGNLNVNSSDYWNTGDQGSLRNVSEIQGSWITNDLGWINQTYGNSTYALNSSLEDYYLVTNPFGFYNSTSLANVSQLLNDNGYYNSTTLQNVSQLVNDAGYFNSSNLPTSNSTAWNRSGTNVFLANSSDNVGIGTSSPDDELDIEAAHSQLRLTDSDDNNFTQLSYSSDFLAFRNNNLSMTPILSIHDDGFVGIGTSTPSSTLEVAGDGSTTIINASRSGTTRFSVGNGNNETAYVGGGLLTDQIGAFNLAEFRDSGVTRFIIEDGGDVGIGTSSPEDALHVEGNVTIGGTLLRFEDSTSGGDSSLVRAIQFNNNDLFQYDDTSNTYSFQFDGTTSIVFDDGDVGIGTTSPGVELEVSSTSPQIRLTDSDGTIDTATSWLEFYNSTTRVGYVGDGSSSNDNIYLNADSGDIYLRTNTATEVLTVSQAGLVGIGTTSPDGTLHAHTATAGTVTAHASADDLIVENSATGGISILTPAGTQRNIYFGSPTTNVESFIRSEDDTLFIESNSASNLLALNTIADGDVQIGANNEIYVDGSSNEVGIGTSSPSATLDVTGAGGGLIAGEFTATGNTGSGGSFTGIDSNAVQGTTSNAVLEGGDFSASGSSPADTRGIVVGASAAAGTGEVRGGSFSATGGTSGTIYGVHSSGTDYDFYAAGAGTNYGPFTGGHEVKLSKNFPKEIKPGMIVSFTGETQFREEDGEVSISSTLPTVKLSSSEKDKKVFGAFTSIAPLGKEHWYYNKSKPFDSFAIVNALGEGRVWVTNMGGEIEAGDYITTSKIPGYGMEQEDDLLHSYTLGKATEDVDWSKVTETVEYKGKEYKAYLVGVIYTSG